MVLTRHYPKVLVKNISLFPLNYIKMNYIKMNYIKMNYIKMNYIKMNYIKMNYIKMNYIKMNYISFIINFRCWVQSFGYNCNKLQKYECVWEQLFPNINST